jgi:hypothetical protein
MTALDFCSVHMPHLVQGRPGAGAPERVRYLGNTGCSPDQRQGVRHAGL